MTEANATGTSPPDDGDGWENFDTDAYFAHYYGDPHPDDDEVVRLTCAALKAAEPSGLLSTIDVGTGPNLYPMFTACRGRRT